jgi:hypothetical protein
MMALNHYGRSGMSLVFPVPEDTRERVYTASEGQTVFNVPFPFQNDEDLAIAVLAHDADEDADYTGLSESAYSVSGAGSDSGGSITLNVGRTADDKVRVRGAAVLERLTSIVRAGKYDAAALDADLDRLMIIAQELARAVSVVEVAQAVAGGGDMVKATYDTDNDGKVDAAAAADAVPWAGITGKPDSFTPASHSHTASDVTDFTTAADARITAAIGSAVQAYQAAQDTSTWEAGTGTTESVVSPAKMKAAILALAPGGGGGGSGDMAKSTYDTNDDGKVDAADAADAAPWAGITGKPATFTPAAHSHTASDVTDFNTAADARISAAIGSAVQAYDADTAKTDVAQTFSALQASSVETLSDGATITPTGTKNLNQVTLGGNRTMANPTAITAGATYLFKIIQDATGSRTLAWGAAYKFPGGTPPALTTDANGVDVFSGVSFDGTTIQMFTPGQDFS